MEGVREFYQHGAALSYVTQRVPLFITTASVSLNANNPTFAGYNIRQSIGTANLITSGNPVRLTLTPVSAGTGAVISGMWIGATTSFPDFVVAPTQVLFSGSSTITMIAGGSAVVTDPVALTIPTSIALMASFAITLGDIRFNTGGSSNNTNYFKALASSQSSNTLNPGAGTTQTNSAGIITLVEVMG